VRSLQCCTLRTREYKVFFDNPSEESPNFSSAVTSDRFDLELPCLWCASFTVFTHSPQISAENLHQKTRRLVLWVTQFGTVHVFLKLPIIGLLYSATGTKK